VWTEALAQPALLARDRKDPDLATLARRLLHVRQQLAGLTFAAPPGQDRERQQRLEGLAAREEELAKELRRAGSTAVPQEVWVELDDLRRKLPRGAALIDVARLKVFDFKAGHGQQWCPARYAAWVIRAGEDVRLIDLGPAA
jgi:hypothetical protein